MSQTSPPTVPSPDEPRLLFVPAALVCVLPLFPPETRGSAMAGAAALIALWTVVCLARPVMPWRLLPLALGLVAFFPAVLVAHAPGSVIRPISIWILALGVGASASVLRAEDRRRDTVAMALALTASIVALHGIYQILWGLDDLVARVEGGAAVADRQLVLERAADGRAFAAFPTPAALGGFLAVCLPITLGVALGRTGPLRWFLIGIAALQGAALLGAASATAAASLLAAVILGAAVARPGSRRVLAAVALGAVLLAGVVLVRGAQVTDVDAAGSPWRLRATNYRAAAAMIADHPWVGVGIGNFGEVYPRYRLRGDNETQHAHDLPLELCAEFGLPAGILVSGTFFYIFLGPLFRRREDLSPWARGAAIGLAALAIQSLVDFTILLPSLLWLAAVLRGLLAVPRRPVVAASGPVLRLGALVAVLAAAGLAGLSGMAWEARMDAKQLLAAGERGAAERRVVGATRLAPWNPDGWLYLSELSLERSVAEGEGAGEARLASQEAVERAIALSPVRPSARIVRARLRALAGDLPGAYADALEATRLYPIHDDYAASREALARALDASARAAELHP